MKGIDMSGYCNDCGNTQCICEEVKEMAKIQLDEEPKRKYILMGYSENFRPVYDISPEWEDWNKKQFKKDIVEEAEEMYVKWSNGIFMMEDMIKFAELQHSAIQYLKERQK